jgi:hypothetical protein
VLPELAQTIDDLVRLTKLDAISSALSAVARGFRDARVAPPAAGDSLRSGTVANSGSLRR